MNHRILTALSCAAALGLAGAVHADEKSETKMTKESNSKGSHSKVEKSSKSDPAGMNNSVSNTSSTDVDTHKNSDGTSTTTMTKDAKHDAPGMKNDKKMHSKEKITRDAAGNVVKDEKTNK